MTKLPKDRMREYQRNRRAKDPSIVKRQYEKLDKAKVLKAQKARRLTKTGWSKSIISNIRARAKLEGTPFDITFEDVMVPDICPALKCPIVMGHFRYGPSVDRIIPSLGYVRGNVAVISRRANMIKQDCTDPQELRLIADFVERGLTK